MTTYVRAGNTVGVLQRVDSRVKEGRFHVEMKHTKTVENFHEVSRISEAEYNTDQPPQPTKQPTKRGSKKS